MNHKKHTARENAIEKIEARDHLPGAAEVPRSQEQLSHQRFAGETPLTGEDRPVEAKGGKQEGFDNDAAVEHGAAGHPVMQKQGKATMKQANSTDGGGRGSKRE